MSDLTEQVILGVSDFVALLNQTLEFAYPRVTIVGELANYRVSKNKWVYFDLKDETSSVKFFGTIYSLPGPLEDGMMLQVSGNPRLHQQYGFSVNIQSIRPVGEGSLKQAAKLLAMKLEKEGLFDPDRKRDLPYPPKRIALIASKESAGYVDFIKILGARWGGIQIDLCDVQVQGEAAIAQIVGAIDFCNSLAHPPEVIVITRGGGSADDLAVFNTEQVTRAIAASRVPTLVAIGHEIDVSLAELAADRRASTPSNAAESLTPDKLHEQSQLTVASVSFAHALRTFVSNEQTRLARLREQMLEGVKTYITNEEQYILNRYQLLHALDPSTVLKRGYAVIRSGGAIIQHIEDISAGQEIVAGLHNGIITAKVISVKKRSGIM